MSKNVIFCYSGSGNCLDIAKNIAKRLGDTDIVMMRAEPEVKDVRGAKRVGFVFPCYAGGLPGDVEKFVSELRVDSESYTFGVVSYAGYPGVGMAKINDIVPLDYWAGISHQCSCIWLMPHTLMLPMLDASRAQARSEKLAAKIADDVLYVKHLSGRPLSNPVNALEAKAWPMLSGNKAAKMTVSVTKRNRVQRTVMVPPSTSTLRLMSRPMVSASMASRLLRNSEIILSTLG